MNNIIVERILDRYPNAVTADCVKQKNAALSECKTNTYVYLLIADGEVWILGEGTSNRGNVIFPGYSAPAHIKAIPAALIHHVCVEKTRVIIPTANKKESLAIEKDLKALFNFHEKGVDEKTRILVERREAQLKYPIINDKLLMTGFASILYATGTDVGTYKKNCKAGFIAEEAMKKISEIVGDYYTDL